MKKEKYKPVQCHHCSKEIKMGQTIVRPRGWRIGYCSLQCFCAEERASIETVTPEWLKEYDYMIEEEGDAE